MADAKISDLAAADALDGSELIPVVQGGANKKATGNQLKTFTNAGLVVPALVAVGEIVTAGSQSEINFSSEIPADTYQDLEIILRNARGTAALTEVILQMQFNGDTGNNYDDQQEFGDNASGAHSHAQGRANIRSLQFPAASATANFVGGTLIRILGYRLSRFKECTSFGGESFSQQRTVHTSGQWRGTAAINAIKLFLSSGAFADGTVASLYARR